MTNDHIVSYSIWGGNFQPRHTYEMIEWTGANISEVCNFLELKPADCIREGKLVLFSIKDLMEVEIPIGYYVRRWDNGAFLICNLGSVGAYEARLIDERLI